MGNYVLPTELVLTWRRHLHQHPELSFKEFDTANYIATILGGVEGLTIERPTETGVVAILKGTAGEGPTIAFRADIDALPVKEETDVDYKSVNDGISHTCGHDMHAAMLMGSATVLAGMRDELKGTVKFIFQPAEEVPPGGAIQLINAGVLADVDHCFGLHVVTDKLGTVRILKGEAATTSCDACTIKIQGKGSHGSMPHFSIDPILVGAQIVEALHTIVARNIDPDHFAVVSPTVFHGGNFANVIPDTAEISVNVRTKNNDDREFIIKRINEIAEGVAKNHGATLTIDWTRGYGAVQQDLDLVDRIAQVAVMEMGAENVLYGHSLTASEDFSEYTKVVNSCMYFTIGGGNKDDGCPFANHHPKFNPREECMDIGVRMEVAVAHHLLFAD